MLFYIYADQPDSIYRVIKNEGTRFGIYHVIIFMSRKAEKEFAVMCSANLKVFLKMCMHVCKHTHTFLHIFHAHAWTAFSCNKNCHCCS
jgi:hypothetical protein